MPSTMRVYLAMLEFRPPHRPRSDVTATVAVLAALTAAGGRGGACMRGRAHRAHVPHAHAAAPMPRPRTHAMARMLLQGRCPRAHARTRVVAKQLDERVHAPARVLHGYLRVLHLGRGNHLHGLGDLADVLDGADALLHCGRAAHGGRACRARCRCCCCTACTAARCCGCPAGWWPHLPGCRHGAAAPWTARRCGRGECMRTQGGQCRCDGATAAARRSSHSRLQGRALQGGQARHAGLQPRSPEPAQPLGQQPCGSAQRHLRDAGAVRVRKLGWVCGTRRARRPVRSV